MADPDAAFDRVVAELQAGEPEDFVARRTATARDLRRRGEQELAARVASLRRPALSVWAANRLREVAPDQLEALLATGHALREAQLAAAGGRARSGGAADFAALVSAHSGAVGAAVDQAAAFLSGQGRDASDVVLRRLQATLRAASLGGPDRRAALTEGRLTADLHPEGFGGFGDVAPTGPEEGTEAPPLNHLDARLTKAAQAARQVADQQLRNAREARDHAQALHEQAERLVREARAAAEAASAAEARAAAAEEEVEPLEQEATRAEAEVEAHKEERKGN